MPKVEYPKWLYKAKDKKKDSDPDETLSLLVKTPEDHAEASKKGYHEDPDTAHGRERPHPEPAEGTPWPGDVPAGTPAAGPKVEYPKWLYRRGPKDKKGVSKLDSALVPSYEAHTALKGVWYEEPPDEADDSAPAVQGATGGPQVLGTSAQSGINARTGALTTVDADEELNAPFDPSGMTVAAVQVQVDVMGNIESLRVVAGSEEAGANRQGVKAAIAKRIKFLEQKIADDQAAADTEPDSE